MSSGERGPKRSGRRISKAGWATILALVISAVLWAILIAVVVYLGRHHPIAHGP